MCRSDIPLHVADSDEIGMSSRNLVLAILSCCHGSTGCLVGDSDGDTADIGILSVFLIDGDRQYLGSILSALRRVGRRHGEGLLGWCCIACHCWPLHFYRGIGSDRHRC